MSNNIRIVGSNYTYITWQQPDGGGAGGNEPAYPGEGLTRPSEALAYLQTVQDSGQTAYNNQPYSAIYEIGYSYPVDFVVQEVATPGTLQMSLLDVWDAPAWERLTSAFAGAANITDINKAQLQFATLPKVHIIIKPPEGKGTTRGKTCHDVLITAIPDNDSVQIGELQKIKTINAVYRYATPLAADSLGFNFSPTAPFEV